MNSESRRIAVSTDIAVGWPLYHPCLAVEMYRSAGLQNFGVEVVPLLYGTVMMAQASYNGNKLPEGLEMEGVHGRMGALPSANEHGKGVADYLKIKVLDFMLPHFHPWLGVNLDKIATNLEHPVYYNIHHELVTYSEEMYKHYLNRFVSLEKVLLAVENGPTKDGVDKTHGVVARYRDNGLNAVATIDVLHAAVEFGDYDDSLAGVQKVWSRVLQGIQPDTRQIHFPIGLTDNLPTVGMLEEKHMIKDLVARMDETGVELVVIENQHGYFTGVNDKERARLGRIIPELVALGLIGESHLAESVPAR